MAFQLERTEIVFYVLTLHSSPCTPNLLSLAAAGTNGVNNPVPHEAEPSQPPCTVPSPKSHIAMF